MAQSVTLVVTSAVPWQGATARPHHFAKELARRGWDVLYVNGPITWLSPLKNPDLLSRNLLLPRLPIQTPPLATGSGRLRILAPVASLPFGNMHRWINRFNQRLLASQIRFATDKPLLLLPMLPGAVDLIPHLTPVATLYDCVDLHSHFSGFVNTTLVEDMERNLAYASRVVFVTAIALQEHMNPYHSDVRLVPNAAEIEHFRTAKTVNLHPLLRDIPEPRVGFVGGLGAWVDYALIADMAKQRPQIQFVLVGPQHADVSALNSLHNVHLLGLQPYQELPQFLRGFDVTLHAFVRNELTQSVNPIKIYEYLAAGKQVIATTSEELKRLDEVLWLVNSSEEAVAALDRILTGETRTSAAAQAEYVSRQSWSARVDQIESALLAVLPTSLRDQARADA
ncbi:glycosyltransferase family 1 protein [Alicyclobacillaceae bacterium I2511]|nr:glycosyltransferase family 1 protein [Alicyclobacillaceae bacterium I2511]